MARPNKVRLALAPFLSTFQPERIKKANDHEIALRQLMERVAMLIDNAKFIKRDWVAIEWSQLHWVRPGPEGGVKVNEISAELRRAICVALTAKGYTTKHDTLRVNKPMRTVVRWGR